MYFPLAWKYCNVWPRCIQLPLRTHNQTQPQATAVYHLNCRITTLGGRWKRVEGGQSGARQQAENLSHRHLTKSRWSPFSRRQKKNRRDGQAEQKWGKGNTAERRWQVQSLCMQVDVCVNVLEQFTWHVNQQENEAAATWPRGRSLHLPIRFF